MNEYFSNATLNSNLHKSSIKYKIQYFSHCETTTNMKGIQWFLIYIFDIILLSRYKFICLYLQGNFKEGKGNVNKILYLYLFIYIYIKLYNYLSNYLSILGTICLSSNESQILCIFKDMVQISFCVL